MNLKEVDSSIEERIVPELPQIHCANYIKYIYHTHSFESLAMTRILAKCTFLFSKPHCLLPFYDVYPS